MNSILEIMDECYDRFNSDLPIVDLVIFETQSSMEGFRRSEQEKLGVSSLYLGGKFLATHEAWTGIPKILVCSERLQRVPEKVFEGAMRHEVAHSILHGSPLYYFIPIPEAYRELRRDLGLSKRVVSTLTYFTSIAVKDFEVTRALYGLGYDQDQVAYNLCLLKPDVEDVIAWRVASREAGTAALCLASSLKPVLSAAPLIVAGRITEDLARRSIQYLPKRLQGPVLKTCLETECGKDTLENIENFAKTFKDNVLSDLTA